MIKKSLLLLLIITTILSLSCSNDPQKNINTSNKIGASIWMEKNILRLGEKSTVNISVEDTAEYTVKFKAQYGAVRKKKNWLEYTAPSKAPPDFVDTITALIKVDGETYQRETHVLVLGPESASQWISTGGPDGGDISLIEVDQKSAGVLYAAGSGSRLFKSIDNGETWRGLIVEPDESGGRFYEIKIAPADSNIIYAIYNHTLFISHDAGASWKKAIDDGVHDIETKEAYPDMLFVMTNEGMRISRDFGESFENITGNLPNGDQIKLIVVSETEFWIGTVDGGNGRVYRTTDSGQYWQMVDMDYPADADVHSIYLDPDDFKTIYVSFIDINNIPLDERRPQFLQRTKDEGESWEWVELPDTDTMISVLGKSKSGTLFISSGSMTFMSEDNGSSFQMTASDWIKGDATDIGFDVKDSASIFLPIARNGILKSEDNGKTWQLKVQGLDNLKVSLLVSQHTEQNQTVYVSSVGGEGLFKTVDFGRNWENTIEGTKIHPWGDELQLNPHDPDELWYIADIGSVFVTEDGGHSWSLWYDPTNDKPDEPKRNGFRFSSIYSFAIAPSESDIIYAVKSGFGIFKSENGGENWEFLNNSEVDYSYNLEIDPENPDVVYSGNNPKPFQNFAMIRKTEDGGETWKTALNLEGSNGITSICVDPNKSDTVYAGSIGEDAGLWVSRNAGDDWNRLCSQLSFTNVHNMATDPIRPEIAYAGVWGGGTYRTEDKGKSWKRLNNDPTDSAIAILPDRSSRGVLYIADRMTPKVYKSIDDGETWTTYFDAGERYYRILSAEISESDPSVMYVSALKYGSPFEGALFKIEDGDTVKIEGIERVPVSIDIDPDDSGHIIVVSHAGGVLESKNSGQSWSSINENSKGLPDKFDMSYNKIVFDPDESDTIYLIGGGDVVMPSMQPSGISIDEVNTVYRSVDAGKTWRNLNDGNLGENSGSVKGISFGQNGDIYVGCTNGIFSSSDGGSSWQDAGSDISYRCTAGVDTSSDGLVIYAPMLGGGVFAGDLSDDKVSWQAESMLRVPIHHALVSVHPTDSETIYASAYPGGIFKSVDGGITFTENNFGLPSFKVDDPLRQGYYAFQVALSDPDTLYLGVYGKGIYVSKDGANTWRAINGADNSMREKGIYALAIDPDDASVVTVSAEEGVFRTKDAGESWQHFMNGLPERLQVRTLDIGPDQRLFAGTLGYDMFNTPSSNDEWEQMHAISQFGVFWPVWNDRPLYQYTSLLFNKNDENKILFGTFPSGIFRSDDGGETWQESNIGFTNDGIFYLTYHPNNDQIIYAGTYNGVNRSTDQGKTWEMWDDGWPDEQWVFSIDFDPNNPDIMYACSKNGENEGVGTDDFGGTVMKSTDGGSSWFSITNGLDCEQEFYKILVDHHDASILYLATEWDGVYISRDAGQSWESWNDGLTNKTAGVNSNNVTNTMLISPDGNLIYFGTAGDGVFRRLTETVAEKWG